jgi:hypothetical protein
VSLDDDCVYESIEDSSPELLEIKFVCFLLGMLSLFVCCTLEGKEYFREIVHVYLAVYFSIIEQHFQTSEGLPNHLCLPFSHKILYSFAF